MILSRLVSVIFSLLIFGFPVAAFAQSAKSETCGMMDDTGRFQSLMYLFLGPWQVTHLSGYVVAGTMLIPFPADGATETVDFEQSGNDLIAVHPEMQAPMVFTLADEAPWAFMDDDTSAGMGSPALTSGDIELLTNCSIEDIPRLIGRTTAIMDGVEMDFVWRLYLIDGNQMFAVQHTYSNVNGMAVVSRRTVSLTR